MALATVVAIAACAAASLRIARFDNTLDMMLPADSPAQRMIAFLREASFADKVVITLESTNPDAPAAALAEAASAFAASLGPPLIARTISAGATPDMMRDAAFFLDRAPEILGARDLAEIESWLSPEEVDRRLRLRYRQLLKPEGLFTARTLQADPLDIASLVRRRLMAVIQSVGYDVTVRDGHFVSRDGRHLMIVAETPASLADSAQSRRLLDYLRDRIARLPPGVSATVIAGHTHTVSNEDVIKRDLGIVFTLACSAFVALFVLYFRDPRAFLVFLIPAISAVIALACVAQGFARLSYLVLGFGPVICFA